MSGDRNQGLNLWPLSCFAAAMDIDKIAQVLECVHLYIYSCQMIVVL